MGKTFNPLRPQEKIDLVMKKKRNKLVTINAKRNKRKLIFKYVKGEKHVVRVKDPVFPGIVNNRIVCKVKYEREK